METTQKGLTNCGVKVAPSSTGSARNIKAQEGVCLITVVLLCPRKLRFGLQTPEWVLDLPVDERATTFLTRVRNTSSVC